MAEKSGFFNSVNGDRRYKANFFAEYFASFIGNGVFPKPSNALQVIADTNMNIVVKAGKGWINGYYYNNDTDLTLTLDTADGVLNRIDKIVLQFNTLSRTIAVKIKKGAFASAAVAPALQRDSNAYELALADVYIPKGSINVLQSNITDIRLDSGRCGIVHGTVDQVDTTTLFNQYQTWLNDKKTIYDADFTSWTTQKKTDYESWYNTTIQSEKSEIDAMEVQFQNDFNTWFQSVKSTLDGDAVGNLTNRINAIPKVFKGAIEPLNPAAADIWHKDLENGSIQINERNANNTAWVEVFPKTKAGDVITDAGLDMEAQLADLQKVQTAGGTATAITLNNVNFTDGFTKTFIVNANNSAAATTVNGKPLYKPNTTNPPNLTKGKAVTIWYDLAKAAFFFKASAEGNVSAGLVLTGYTFSNDDDTAIAGTMPNNGALNKSLAINGTYTIPAGYTSGGSVTQSITTKAAATITPTTSDQTIAANQYLAGTQTIKGDANLISPYIVSGKSIFNVQGSATAKSLGGYAVGDVLSNNQIEHRLEDQWGFSARGGPKTAGTVLHWYNGYVHAWMGGAADGTYSKLDKNGAEVSALAGTSTYYLTYEPIATGELFVFSSTNTGTPYISRRTAAGGIVWQAAITNGKMTNIGTDGSNVWLTSATTSTSTVYKYDYAGNRLWAKAITTSYITDGIQYANGYIYFYDGNWKFHKCDGEGNIVWTYSTGGTIPGKFVIDDYGNVVMATGSEKVMIINSNGLVVGNYSVKTPKHIAVDNDRYIYVTSVAGSSQYYYCITCMNPNGITLWQKFLDAYEVYGIIVDDEKSVYYTTPVSTRYLTKMKQYYVVVK